MPVQQGCSMLVQNIISTTNLGMCNISTRYLLVHIHYGCLILVLKILVHVHLECVLVQYIITCMLELYIQYKHKIEHIHWECILVQCISTYKYTRDTRY